MKNPTIKFKKFNSELLPHKAGCDDYSAVPGLPALHPPGVRPQARPFSGLVSLPRGTCGYRWAVQWSCGKQRDRVLDKPSSVKTYTLRTPSYYGHRSPERAVPFLRSETAQVNAEDFFSL